MMPSAPWKTVLTPPAPNVILPLPFAATVILPLLEDTIELPLTSNEDVKLA